MIYYLCSGPSQRKVARQRRLWKKTTESNINENLIHRTIKSTETNSILKETKLKLPKTLSSKQTRQPVFTKHEACCEEEVTRQKAVEPVNIKRSCSLQFINSGQLMHGCKQEDFDNTTPDELAAYMEQILHFPKPMSAMAEMMYG